MGQLFSNLRRWLWPETTKESQIYHDHQTNYKTFYDDDDDEVKQDESHFINILDDHQPIISSDSSTGILGILDNNYLDSSADGVHIVVDLIRGNEEEDAKEEKDEKPIIKLDYGNNSDDGDQILEKYVTGEVVNVGEGDNSFSPSLAVALGTSPLQNVATSLNSKDFLLRKYRKFVNNKADLETRGGMVLHGVNATKMAEHPVLGSMISDRIIFNFPHSGKFGYTRSDLGWICPKKRNETLSNIHQQSKYQPISVDEDHLLISHHIDIPDYAALVNTTENVGNHDINLVDIVVVDLSSEYEEVAKKRKRKKKKKQKKEPNKNDNGVQLTVSEAVFEKSVTTSISHHHQVVPSVKKIEQYTSAQRLLLVGEGDFSFSACLAIAFGTSAVNIVSTSLNSQDFLMKNYGNFIKNKAELQSRGSMVLHDVDATKMVKHPVVGSMVFDRIIFNFPHAGRFGHNDTELRAHQKLIGGFLRNAKKMIGEDGEIHITSKSNGFYLDWDIPKIGRDYSLNLIEEIRFGRSKYPGYSTKYGFGGDRDFDCNPSKTYKFGLSSK